MRLSPAYAALLLALALIAGGLGAFATSRWMGVAHAPASMHEFVHSELKLTPAQETRLDELERGFAAERRTLDLALKSANAQLAAAIEDEHHYGPKVGAAIDEVHARMGDLQKATVRHVFDMRALLDAEQKKAFDSEVNKALTSDPDD